MKNTALLLVAVGVSLGLAFFSSKKPHQGDSVELAPKPLELDGRAPSVPAPEWSSTPRVGADRTPARDRRGAILLGPGAGLATELTQQRKFHRRTIRVLPPTLEAIIEGPALGEDRDRIVHGGRAYRRVDRAVSGEVCADESDVYVAEPFHALWGVSSMSGRPLTEVMFSVDGSPSAASAAVAAALAPEVTVDGDWARLHPPAFLVDGSGENFWGWLGHTRHAWSPLRVESKRPGALVQLGEASSLEVAIRSFRPPPDAVLRLEPSSTERPIECRLRDVLPLHSDRITFEGLPPGEVRVSVVPRVGGGQPVASASSELRAGETAHVHLDLAALRGDDRLPVSFEVVLPAPYELLKIQLGAEPYLALDPMDDVTALNLSPRPPVRRISALSPIEGKDDAYRWTIPRGLRPGSYRVTLSPPGLRCRVAIGPDLPDTQTVEFPPLAEARVSVAFDPAIDPAIVSWSGACEVHDGAIQPAHVVADAPEQLMIFSAPGELKLIARTPGWGNREFSIPVEPGYGAHTIHLEPAPGVLVRFTRQGSPVPLTLDDWTTLKLLDPSGESRAVGVRPVDLDLEAGVARGALVWATTPGTYRLMFPKAANHEDGILVELTKGTTSLSVPLGK